MAQSLTHSLIARITAALLLNSFFADAANCQKLKQVPEHSLIRIALADDEDATVDAVRPIENVVDEEQTERALIWTGPPGLYRLSIIAITDGKFDRSRRRRELIEIVASDAPNPSPNPNPPPGPGPNPVTPGPRPDGLAGQIYDAALKAGKQVECAKLAQVFQAVAAKMQVQSDGGQQSYQSQLDALKEIAGQIRAIGLSPGWKPVKDVVSIATQQNSGNWYSTKDSIEQIGLGFYRASGGK